MSLTFRNSKIVYYGPHLCDNCGALICKMAREFGGNAFDYPPGIIYPNSEWYPHVCDLSKVGQVEGIVGQNTTSGVMVGNNCHAGVHPVLHAPPSLPPGVRPSGLKSLRSVPDTPPSPRPHVLEEDGLPLIEPRGEDDPSL